MKLIINIPEENYERLKFMEEMGALNNPYLETIANGTPLPKGHGRLIDVERLYDDFESMDYDFEDAIEYAPTIIEADVESEE